MDVGADARAALAEARAIPVAAARAELPDRPGLYAVYVSADGQRELALEQPSGPVYLGKAERSIHARDAGTHFAAGRTGWSTLRRSLAACLASPLGLRPVPRSPGSRHWTLDPRSEQQLQEWIQRHLSVAAWAPKDVGIPWSELERELLQDWDPPLNLRHVAPTAVRAELRRRRRELARQASP